MQNSLRTTMSLVGMLTAACVLTGCGESGSSGTLPPPSAAAGAGCAPIADDELVVLGDDKKLQTVDNIIPAVNAQASSSQLIAALDKVSAALSTTKLVSLNKAVDVDRKTPRVAAAEFADSAQLTSGITKGTGGRITIGVANFSENQILGELYRIALAAAGFEPEVRQIGNREVYEPALERGEIQVVPEYTGTLTEFLNKKVNGASAAPLASSDLDQTVTALKGLGERTGLTFGTPSPAADQNAFAVTRAFADKHELTTLTDFARSCSGKDTVLGGPPECPQRPFCQPGLEKTYGISFGSFSQLDAGGPLTKTALKDGKISIGLVFSSDGALAAG